MFGAVTLGATPRVVGTITSAAAFMSLAHFPCDIAEVRLDKIGARAGWLARCQQIEAGGVPVLLTMRCKHEGGDCAEDEGRWPIYEEALALAGVDIELRSHIAPEVAALAQKRGRACVLSYHDFHATPSMEKLESVAAEAEELGGITKIATMIKAPVDVEILRALLKKPRRQPLCVIGMGPAWTHLRVSLAQEGSCLTYGFLDSSAAPGQLAASELQAKLRG
ncbi:MAG TPA: type I 3-dehydroquinate dehydratase [Verrucomicrobiae bacterium]|jgi:3-dehydroquinate dehydratase-1|nr:type I 3-dehydroquinate dehydratase [Verrucomicrobiae bacterium]